MAGSLIPFPEVCAGSIGGLAAVRAWPVANVRRYPAYAGNTLVERIELLDERDYADLLFQDGSAGFEEPQAETDQGLFYKPKLQLLTLRDSPGLMDVVDYLTKRRYFIVSYQDANGFTKLVGTREWPLRFAAELETGKRVGDRNAYSMSFLSECPGRAPFYMAQQKFPPQWGRAFSLGFNTGFQ